MIFSISEDYESVPVGTFIDLGDIPQGRQRILLLGIKPACSDLTVVEKIPHTSDCLQYLLKDTTEVIVGSIFETKISSTTLKPMVLHVTSNKDLSQFTPTKYGGDVSHANVYLDPADNIVVVPYNPNLTFLCVNVEDDR